MLLGCCKARYLTVLSTSLSDHNVFPPPHTCSGASMHSLIGWSHEYWQSQVHQEPKNWPMWENKWNHVWSHRRPTPRPTTKVAGIYTHFLLRYLTDCIYFFTRWYSSYCGCTSPFTIAYYLFIPSTHGLCYLLCAQIGKQSGSVTMAVQVSKLMQSSKSH